MMSDDRSISRRMCKTANDLTRPTLACQEALFHEHDRSGLRLSAGNRHLIQVDAILFPSWLTHDPPVARFRRTDD